MHPGEGSETRGPCVGIPRKGSLVYDLYRGPPSSGKLRSQMAFFQGLRLGPFLADGQNESSNLAWLVDPAEAAPKDKHHT